MARLVPVLGDQLSATLSSLKDCDHATDVILMSEVYDEATYVKHHQKKIAFLFSAMRHFALELKDQGYNVRYTRYDDPENSGSILGEVQRFLAKNRCDRIVVTHPGEYRVLQNIRSWQEILNIPVEIREDDRFLCPPDCFAAWAKNRKQLRMEYFYREMRKKYKGLDNFR